MTETFAPVLAGAGGLQRVLELARRHLDMDLAILAEFTDGKQVNRGLAGDAASFGFALHDGPSLGDTYCQRMTQGELPHVIADTRDNALVRDLPLTRDADIGSYVGVPITLADGSVYGSLCTLSHASQPVDDRDARFLRMLAELVASDLQDERNRANARARIQTLIDNGALQIALQPIIDLSTGNLLGVEALSRFPAGQGPPDEVFAAAHAVGLGNELEELATRAALRLLPLLGPEQYLAINLTPSVAIHLVKVAISAGLPLDRLVLEITEHAAVENYTVLRDALSEGRRQGLRLAIDDAGAGYASLHHVVELHPDIIKIDRSLIEGLSEDPARRSVVKAFVAVAGDLEAVVVAEGVENAPDLSCAKDLGVDAAQGYLLARPDTDHELLQHWRERTFALAP
jgi:EAL domain-containing protein (putative c-di-GMP-specific phosphodiesterase class I)